MFRGESSLSVWTLLLKIVNTRQTKPFEIGQTDLAHIYNVYSLLQEEDAFKIFWNARVKGQGHTLNIVVRHCKYGTVREIRTFIARTVKIGTYTHYLLRGDTALILVPSDCWSAFEPEIAYSLADQSLPLEIF